MPSKQGGKNSQIVACELFCGGRYVSLRAIGFEPILAIADVGPGDGFSAAFKAPFCWVFRGAADIGGGMVAPHIAAPTDVVPTGALTADKLMLAAAVEGQLVR
jgi:hypothetical protein